jgi:hypothetical protein
MHLAYERVVRLLEDDPVERLDAINVDVPALVTRVLGAVPRILEHRGLLAQLVTFDVSQVDHLRDYALALAHAHGLRRAAPPPPRDVAELAHAQKLVRQRLLADARALASHALLDPKRIARLHSGRAYLAIAFDVLALVGLFLESWSNLEGKTAVTRGELDQARSDAERLVAAVGRSRRLRPERDRREQRFRQIYTRLFRAYSDVRHALSFVRRVEGDASRIAPSPFGRRKKSPRKRAGPSRERSRDA